MLSMTKWIRPIRLTYLTFFFAGWIETLTILFLDFSMTLIVSWWLRLGCMTLMSLSPVGDHKEDLFFYLK